MHFSVFYIPSPVFYSTSIFPFMTMISFFYNIFHLSNIYFQIFIYKYNRFLHFLIIPATLLLITSFFPFRIVFISCSPTNSQKFFIPPHHPYASCLFSMILNASSLQTLKKLVEYVGLLLLWMNFQDYFQVHELFLLYIQDLQK